MLHCLHTWPVWPRATARCTVCPAWVRARCVPQVRSRVARERERKVVISTQSCLQAGDRTRRGGLRNQRRGTRNPVTSRIAERLRSGVRSVHTWWLPGTCAALDHRRCVCVLLAAFLVCVCVLAVVAQGMCGAAVGVWLVQPHALTPSCDLCTQPVCLLLRHSGGYTRPHTLENRVRADHRRVPRRSVVRWPSPPLEACVRLAVTSPAGGAPDLRYKATGARAAVSATRLPALASRCVRGVRGAGSAIGPKRGASRAVVAQGVRGAAASRVCCGTCWWTNARVPLSPPCLCVYSGRHTREWFHAARGTPRGRMVCRARKGWAAT